MKFFICFLFLTSLNTFAIEQIVFVYFNDFPPYSFSSSPQQKDAKGIFPEYIKNIFSKINIKVLNESYPWETAQLMVKKGEADGYITSPIDDRREYAYFTKNVSFIVKNFLVYTNKNLDLQIKKIKKIDDLKKYRICDYKGDSWSQKNLQDIYLVTVTRRMECIEKLKKNNIDFLIANIGFYNLIKRENKEAKIFDIPFINKSSTHFHIGIRKSYPQAESIIESLNHYISLESIE
ncbi:substrate-binding periplasmic protein [Fluviispira multicolorata]|nr:transporter substrate-binding domain-containing protein [Fluviispira multicolorata]